MFGIIELGVMASVFSMTGFMVWGLYDSTRYPEHTWRAVGSERSAWQLVIFFGGFLGALIYAASIRPKLRRAHQHPSPAGWYPDPNGQPLARWYDGNAWTHHVAPPAGL